MEDQCTTRHPTRRANAPAAANAPAFFPSGPAEFPCDGHVDAGPEHRGDIISGIHESIDCVAATRVSVLIRGESGTGKEQVARRIHSLSPRCGASFVRVDCRSAGRQSLERELFGRGQDFSQRRGALEAADGGTLFLDGIDEIPLDLQVRLLRVLQERTFKCLGGATTQRVDVRMIAATHRRLDAMVRDNRFREDLYHRLNLCSIEIPPLRQRVREIPLLLELILGRLTAECETVRLSDGAVELLQSYDWPGNLRELSTVLERLCQRYPGQWIDAGQLVGRLPRVLPGSAPSGAEGADSGDRRGPETRGGTMDLIDQPDLPDAGIDLAARMEMRYLRQALRRADGVVARAARLLRMSRAALVEKLRRYDIDRAA